MSLVLWECKKALSKGAEKPQKTVVQLQWARFQQIRKYNKKEKNSMVD